MKEITRKTIIDKLKHDLEPLTYVYALWLEGADATELVDEYSDIDFWVDFEDEYEDEVYIAVENSFSEIAPIDYTHIMNHGHPKIRQRIYHLEGSSKYLMIDFCWQLHSRTSSDSELIKDSKIETAMVLFDKKNVIKFVEDNPASYKTHNERKLAECIYRYSQLNRAEKYTLRGHYLESYAYYNRYILEPLIDLLRLIYTPANSDYYLIHISHHIPEDKLKKLEHFAQISSIEDISDRIPKAKDWFNELLAIFRDKS